MRGATGYRIYRNPTGAFVGSVGANTTSFTVTGLAPGVNHTFVVVATNAHGSSNWSNPVTVRTAAFAGGTGSTVQIRVTGVSIPGSSSFTPVGAGDFLDLRAIISPMHATDRRVRWRSSNVAAATVDSNGRVRGLSPGTTTITVTTNCGGHTANIVITVRQSAINLRNVHSHVMLAMSESAYNRSNIYSTASTRRISDSGWVRFGAPRTGRHGFSMNVYRRAVSGTNQFDYAFAFRGTASLSGWINNFNQTFANSSSGQIQEAERFVDDIISANRVRNVYYTGHSLGGYLSQWKQARNHERRGVRGSGSIRATTFNAPGLIPVTDRIGGLLVVWPGSHTNIVAQKIDNQGRYTNIMNYQIASRDSNGTSTIDPFALLGFNLGTRRFAHSVNVHGAPWFGYHALSEFFDITRRRNNFVR